MPKNWVVVRVTNKIGREFTSTSHTSIKTQFLHGQREVLFLPTFAALILPLILFPRTIYYSQKILFWSFTVPPTWTGVHESSLMRCMYVNSFTYIIPVPYTLPLFELKFNRTCKITICIKRLLAFIEIFLSLAKVCSLQSP